MILRLASRNAASKKRDAIIRGGIELGADCRDDGRNAGNLFNFFHAVHSIQTNAKFKGTGNVALFFDRVAK